MRKLKRMIYKIAGYIKIFLIKVQSQIKVIFSFTKKHLWFINLIISILWIYLAWRALFIAYPQYIDFIQKNEVPNLNWNWEFEFTTEHSSYVPYIGMKDKYDIFLIWAKDEYEWKWEKFESYWNFIKHEKRNKIEFKIIIKWNKLYWFYTLYWNREVAWNMEVELNNEWNEINWFFKTSAADSSWKIIWVKKN